MHNRSVPSGIGPGGVPLYTRSNLQTSNSEVSRVMSPNEYRRAAADLIRRLQSDPSALALAREIDELLRHEIALRIPEQERLCHRLALPAPVRAKRTAIISDIHGNHAGLVAALDDIARQRCDRIVCLGDLVEGGPGNEEVIEAISTMGIPCVRGNHDEINDIELSTSARQFLGQLPERIVEEDLLFVHISPRAICRKINHEVEAWNVFDESAFRLIFVGHVHIPYIFGARSSAYGEALRHPFEYNRAYALSPDDRYIVSVGSIGYGRDSLGKIRYAIYDHDVGTIECRAIDGPILPLDYSLR